jgi:perosamine synthetase
MNLTDTVTPLQECVLAALRDVLPEKAFIPLHEPEFRGNEWDYVKECIDTGWVSSVGKFVDEFERRLAQFTGAPHAVVTVNGTAALHMAMLLAGVQAGDEVIIPALSFVATANAVVHAGAVPHFVDSEMATLGMDPVALRDYLGGIVERRGGQAFNRLTGRRLAAIVPMHAFGHPCDLDGLLAVSREFDIALVEDAAESLGSYYRGRHTGTFGVCAALSFNGNKVMTTGGGGAILISDPELARKAKHLTTTAKRPHAWEFHHDQVAWNYRMPNLNAALGCAQLERLPDMLERKQELAQRYRDVFSSIKGVRFLDQPADCKSNFWLNAFLLDEPDYTLRDSLLSVLNGAGFMARPTWVLLNKLPMYTQSPSAPVPNAERIEASLINIPSSPGLVEDSAALHG